MAVAAERVVGTIDESRDSHLLSEVKVRPSLILSCLGIMVVGVFLALLYLAQDAWMVEAESRLHHLYKEVNLQQAENRKLQFEVERLKSRERIEKIAQERLGMVRAERVEFIEKKVSYKSCDKEGQKSKFLLVLSRSLSRLKLGK
ncbi:MAG: hypothetical protein COS84_02565 [Armatimonadetes bacterium CG07_land_8_20_14_0_80_40_9]|nr:MAG: hypothetical protein COS84_02565 [Armatimonadetes bacterium CG07_land_8_20_14_0_80_40_9]